ncbi:MAG TPA: exopolysaccharide biosynthesis polyprenyl glycosylphosphotransferase, partial [Roseiarcus sp.]|nr:exopolysaccharide biosynthesis polyprenyl glycosylphosphotransferase [Roseiarcus sp.]
GLLPPVESVVEVGFVVAALVVLLNAQRGQYEIKEYASLEGHVGRCISVWNVAFFCVLALGFVTKTTEIFSRGASGVLYVTGFAALAGVHAVLVRLVDLAKRRGALPPRRLVLVGLESQLAAFADRYDLAHSGMEIVSAAVIRDGEANVADDLALAAATVRVLRPDDVFIAVPWSKTKLIEACVDAFLRTPAEIHLGPEDILDRFTEAEVAKLGPIASLSLTRRPLSTLQMIEKRLLDIIIAALALLLLAPFFALVALLIRLDGPGPVFFVQRRYGFNQEPFRIVKFRTMTTMEDNAALKSVTRSDPRVTKIGAFLRRYSVDELPQLINVLTGEMSIIGPRPHALAHDQLYERRIAQYARRHNVKPGITGWAQVRGFRGEIISDEKMRQRVEHDLYYIDHWSFWLDIKILALTVFSPKAHVDAY